VESEELSVILWLFLTIVESMKRIIFITISILCVGRYAISHSSEYRKAYRPHYTHYLKDYLHMVKPLNLLDIQPLDAAAMPLIFRKQQ